MVIAQVTLTNFNAFYSLFKKLMQEGYGGFPEELVNYFLANDYSPQTYSYYLEKNFRRFTIAQENGEIIGFLVGDHSYGGVGFISWLGIEPKWREKGIGKALMQEYENYIKFKNGHLLELYTYPKVKPFYEKLGFVEIGLRESGFYGQKNIIMNKKVGEWRLQHLPGRN